MSKEELIKKITSIEAGQACFITLNDTNGNKFHCECTFVQSEETLFTVSLEEEEVSEWDPKVVCTFSTAPILGKTTVSCMAKIAKYTSNTIELVATENFDPASLRNYFRVNLRVPMTVSDAPVLKGGTDSKWTTSGQTVDISRSGALAILEDECQQTNNLLVTLDLPHPQARIMCKAKLIRIKRLTKKRWLTALHFDQTDSDTCDTITANCLYEQRRQIRENVSID